MWNHRENDWSFHYIPSECVDICISTRTKKDIETGRVCTWNIYLMFRNVSYGYVQVKRDFVGTVDDAKDFIEQYVKKMKEGMPI